MTTFFRTAGLAALLCLAAPIGSALHAQDQVAIKAGRVITMNGAELRDATILVENGSIKEIAAGLDVPWNAEVIDASDKVVMPTYVLAHTAGGMSGENENMANVPFITVQDAVDPSSAFFEEALRNGIGAIHVIPGNRTVIGGAGMVLRPYGKTVEDMTLRTRSGLKLSLGASGGTRMAQIRKLRRALQDGVDLREDLARQKAEFDREKAAGATDKDEFEGEPTDEQKPLQDLLAGKLRAFLYIPTAAEVSEVAYLRETFGLDITLVLGPTCYKAADDIQAMGLPVILDPGAMEYTEVDPITEEETVLSPAHLFADAGIAFASTISTNTGSAQRYPWWQMASAMRHGMDRETALRSMTIDAAKILGLDQELGSIEPGKVANIQILTGDPLSATSWVDTVLLEGEVVYERNADHRLQHLFGEKN